MDSESRKHLGWRFMGTAQIHPAGMSLILIIMYNMHAKCIEHACFQSLVVIKSIHESCTQ